MRKNFLLKIINSIYHRTPKQSLLGLPELSKYLNNTATTPYIIKSRSTLNFFNERNEFHHKQFLREYFLYKFLKTVIVSIVIVP